MRENPVDVVMVENAFIYGFEILDAMPKHNMDVLVNRGMRVDASFHRERLYQTEDEFVEAMRQAIDERFVFAGGAQDGFEVEKNPNRLGEMFYTRAKAIKAASFAFGRFADHAANALLDIENEEDEDFLVSWSRMLWDRFFKFCCAAFLFIETGKQRKLFR